MYPIQRMMPAGPDLEPRHDYGTTSAGVHEDGDGFTTDFEAHPRLVTVVLRVIHDKVARASYDLHVHPQEAFRVYDAHAGGVEVRKVVMRRAGKPYETHESFANGWYARASGRLVGIASGSTLVLRREDPGVPMVRGEALHGEGEA